MGRRGRQHRGRPLAVQLGDYLIPCYQRRLGLLLDAQAPGEGSPIGPEGYTLGIPLCTGWPQLCYYCVSAVMCTATVTVAVSHSGLDFGAMPE